MMDYDSFEDESFPPELEAGLKKLELTIAIVATLAFIGLMLLL